jgi:putative ABC transport system ATP-binding protein
MTIVKLTDICKDYQQGVNPVRVLKNVCLTVDQGEYLAIMGPSGSGKTTLMNLIGCLDVPTSGTYQLEGQNLQDLSDDQLAEIRNKHIGFVFQHFYLLPKMSALDNVALPLLYAGVPLKERRARAEAALQAVGLEDRIHFLPNQLSGGQCQRVAIARAIVTKPALLLADEPTGALDTASGNQIMDIFRQLSQEGMTIIMITHEPSIAACADKTYHILDGLLQIPEENQEGGL